MLHGCVSECSGTAEAIQYDSTGAAACQDDVFAQVQRLLANVLSGTMRHGLEVPHVSIWNVGCYGERTAKRFILQPQVFVLAA